MYTVIIIFLPYRLVPIIFTFFVILPVLLCLRDPGGAPICVRAAISDVTVLEHGARVAQEEGRAHFSLLRPAFG